MRNVFKIIGVIALVAVIGCSIVGCDNGAGGGTPNPGSNQTPVAGDYNISGLSQTAGSVTAVSITAKSGKSTGAVYNIRYNSSSAIPQTAGQYSIIFDVGAAPGWNEASNLFAGTLIVGGTVTPPPPPAQSLNGIWESDHGIVISIYGNKGVFTNIDAFAGWREVEKRGNIKIGDSYMSNITKTGDLKWSFSCTIYNTSYALSSPAPGTITLSPDGQTFIGNVPSTTNPTHTFTRKNVSDLDGVWESDHGIVISIYGNKGVFTNIDAFAGWREVEKRGNIKIGDSYMSNITKTGDLKWSFSCTVYNTSYALLSPAPGTITLSPDGQTFIGNVPSTTNPTHTFTRKQ